MNERTDMDLMD